MPAVKPRVTKMNALARLTTRYDRGSGRTEVLFDDHCIGSIVHYGKYVGTSRSRVKTVYGSRIYGSAEFGAYDIEEEAGSQRALLNKIATAVARGFRDGSIKWQGPKVEPLQIEEPSTTLEEPISPTVK